MQTTYCHIDCRLFLCWWQQQQPHPSKKSNCKYWLLMCYATFNNNWNVFATFFGKMKKKMWIYMKNHVLSLMAEEWTCIHLYSFGLMTEINNIFKEILIKKKHLIASYSKIYVNNYFRFHVYLSMCLWVCLFIPQVLINPCSCITKYHQ